MRYFAATAVALIFALSLASLASADQGEPSLSSRLDTQDSRIAALDAELGGLNHAPDWHGEFTYRMEFDHQSGSPVSDTFRQLACFKLGFTQQLSEQVSVGFRLATTSTAGFGTDPFQRFGSGAGPFDTARIGLDEAYVKYTPKWGGYYSTGTGAAPQTHPKVEMLAGRFHCPVEDPLLALDAK